MNIERIMSPNFNQGRRGQVPDMIVCHITDGTMASAVNHLSNPASQVSAHYVVGRDGRIVQMVELTDTAWANGTSGTTTSNVWHGNAAHPTVRERNINANLYTISIEHEGRWSETQGALTAAQLDATTQLITHIRAEVKRLFNLEIPIARTHLIGHNEIAPRVRPNCPGARFPFTEILQRLAQPPAPAPAPNQPSNFAREAWEWGIAANLTDGTNPQNNATREQLITILHRFYKMGA